MMKSCSAELQPLAFQLAAALERYDAAMAVLTETWLDCDLYLEAGDELKRVKLLAASFAQLLPQATALSIAHAELVSALWNHKTAPPPVRERHAVCVAALRGAARRLLGG